MFPFTMPAPIEIPRERYVGEKDYARCILGDYSIQNSTLPSIKEKYKEENIADLVKHVKPNELLLGAATKDYEDPITIPWGKKSARIVIVGGIGSGKTQLGKAIVFDQMGSKFGNYTFAIDPKLDLSLLDKPQEDADSIERLKKFGLEPSGYEVEFCHPKFLDLFGARGKPYITSLKSFKSLDKAALVKTLIQFFAIQNYPPAIRQLTNVVMSGMPTTLTGFRNTIDEHMEAQKDSMKGGKSPSTMLKSKLEEAILSGTLSGSKKDFFDFPVELATHKNVVMQTSLYAENQATQLIYIKLALSSLINDRREWLRSGGMSGVLDKPITVMIDEGDTFAGKRQGNNPARNTIRSLCTKERMQGFSTVLVSQRPDMLDDVCVSQADYIFTFKPRDIGTKNLLRIRGVPDYIYENVVQRLEWKMTESIKECVCISPDSEEGYTRFFPISPQTAMIKEDQRL